jgi:hypothetical protein
MRSAIRAVPTNQAEGAIMTLSGKNVVVLGGSRGVTRDYRRGRVRRYDRFFGLSRPWRR